MTGPAQTASDADQSDGHYDGHCDGHCDWHPVTIAVPDGTVAGYRTGVEGAPPLLFCHANGFCASAYRRLLTALGSHYDCLAIDLRGHGRTQLPAVARGHEDWSVYACDIAAVLDVAASDLGMSGKWFLAGHSLGAISLVLASADERLPPVAGLLLIEPVIPPLSFRLVARSPLWPFIGRKIPLMKGAFNRRAHWPSRADAAAHYARKPIFARMADGVLGDYLADGLKDAQDGNGVVLACEPEWEGANFMAQGHKVIPALRALQVPVRVLAASRGSTVSIGGRRALKSIGARIEIAPETSHLIALEDIDRCATFLLKAG